MFCGPAFDYQRARSAELSYLAKQLSIFNFVWGSLETVIKLIDPPKVPKSAKPGRTSAIDRALYYLKTNYEPRNPIVFYRDTIAILNDALRVWRPNLAKGAHIENYISLSGIGLSIVKRIRNSFAHGAAHLPEPGEYSGNPEVATKVIEASTRTLLYAIQTLLIAHLNGSSFDITIRENEDGELLSENVHFVLRSLHVTEQKADEAQLLLFDVRLEEG